ncbi:MAG: prepilin peptidase [Clostridia bacterium]|nr:prepilin peptidase [Clostridia bacterium]
MIDITKSLGGLIDTRVVQMSKSDVLTIVEETGKAAIFLLTATLVMFALTRVMKSKGFRFKQPLVMTLGVIYAILLTVFYHGVDLYTIKGFFLFAVLVYASCSDITSHEVDDSVWILIFALALIKPHSIMSMALAANIVFLPQIVIAIIGKKSLGGADIKISTVLAFLLGLERGLVAMFIGLLSAVIVTLIRHIRHRELRGEPFALVPFLSVGAAVLYLI